MIGLYTVTWNGGKREALTWYDMKALIERLMNRGVFDWTISHYNL